MNDNGKLKRIISPLFITFLYILGFGLYVFTCDPGEEGWGYIAAIMICLFSLIPLVLDFIVKTYIKRKELYLIIQIVSAIVMLILYFKWGLISGG